jgi:Na+/phosphate symporter
MATENTPGIKSIVRIALGRTPLPASLATGMAVLLLVPSMLVAGYVTRQTGFDDDCSMLALPAGVILGLVLSITKRNRRWQQILSAIVLLILIVLVAWLVAPVQIPDSVPRGMNRLPYGISQMMKGACLFAVLITAATSMILSFIANLILVAYEQRREW